MKTPLTALTAIAILSLSSCLDEEESFEKTSHDLEKKIEVVQKELDKTELKKLAEAKDEELLSLKKKLAEAKDKEILSLKEKLAEAKDKEDSEFLSDKEFRAFMNKSYDREVEIFEDIYNYQYGND